MSKKFIKALIENINGKMVAVASDNTVDRHGDSLPVEAWDLKNYRKNPVLQFAHNYSIPPVGVAKNIKIDNGKLIFEPVFHEITELARETKKLYDEGIMKAFSVGFLPKQKSDKEELKLELLEISAVPVPANPSALVLEKSIEQEISDEDKIKMENWFKSFNNSEIKEGKVLSKNTKKVISDAIYVLSELLNIDKNNPDKSYTNIELKSKYFKNKGRCQEDKELLEKINNQVGFIARKLKN